MNEEEVNKRVKNWLISQSYHPKAEVPVPDTTGNRSVIADWQGFRDMDKDLVWIESKGSDTPFTDLLKDFIKLCYAVYWGGGSGYLAVPSKEFETLKEHYDFLESVSRVVDKKGKLGVLDVEGKDSLTLS